MALGWSQATALTWKPWLWLSALASSLLIWAPVQKASCNVWTTPRMFYQVRKVQPFHCLPPGSLLAYEAQEDLIRASLTRTLMGRGNGRAGDRQPHLSTLSPHFKGIPSPRVEPHRRIVDLNPAASLIASLGKCSSVLLRLRSFLEYGAQFLLNIIKNHNQLCLWLEKKQLAHF